MGKKTCESVTEKAAKANARILGMYTLITGIVVAFIYITFNWLCNNNENNRKELDSLRIKIESFENTFKIALNNLNLKYNSLSVEYNQIKEVIAENNIIIQNLRNEVDSLKKLSKITDESLAKLKTKYDKLVVNYNNETKKIDPVVFPDKILSNIELKNKIEDFIKTYLASEKQNNMFIDSIDKNVELSKKFNTECQNYKTTNKTIKDVIDDYKTDTIQLIEIYKSLEIVKYKQDSIIHLLK